MTGSLLKLNITGRDGLTLNKAWAAGPVTYLGLQVAGFPQPVHRHRAWQPVGALQHAGVPSSSTSNGSPTASTTCAHNGIETIEADRQAAEAWVAHVNDAANATLLPQAGHSWYLGANIPGKPRVFMPYAGGMHVYRQKCNEIAANGYEGFELKREPVGA